MRSFRTKNASDTSATFICKSSVSSDGETKLTCVPNEKTRSEPQKTHTTRTVSKGEQIDLSNFTDIADRVSKLEYTGLATVLNHKLEQMTQGISKIKAVQHKKKVVDAHCNDFDIDGSTFDYIVVGTGPAGCVLANRLMRAGKTVLLVEAGDDNSDEAKIRETGNPAQQLTSDFPDYYWQGNTIDQLQSQGIMNQWTNGRLLGGGTSINGYQVVSSMANGAAYWDDLAASLGDSRWNSVNMEARMKLLEKFTAYGFIPNATRGNAGEWSIVTRPVYVNTTGPGSDEHKLANMYSTFFGVPIVDDYNTSASPASVAFKRWQLNQIATENMDRESADVAFINPFVDSSGRGIGIARNKLRLVVNTTLVKLLFDPSNPKKCIGAAFTRYGNYRRVNAKEVILCTNFNTSQILQVNGIGPASVLTDAEVVIRQANEHVGRHLINHLLIQLWFFDFSGNLTGLKDPNEPPGSIYAGGAFQEYPTYVPAGNRAIQWIFITFPAGPGATLIIAVPLVLYPKSEGSIKIQNKDPLKIVLADTNYWNDNNGTNIFPPLPDGNSSVNNEANSIDIALMRQAVRDMKNMMVANGMVPFGDVVPGQNLSSADYASDTLLNEKFKAQNVQPHHWQNEVRMGTSASNGAVSSTGKVFGIKGLRVAGAPILAPIPGNLATPSLLTGQVIAEAILAGQ